MEKFEMNNMIIDISCKIREYKRASFKALSKLHLMQQEELLKNYELLGLCIKKIMDSRNKPGEAFLPADSSKPVQKRQGLKKSIYILLLQLYGKYKPESLSSNKMKSEAWHKIANEIKEKSSIFYKESECQNMIKDLKSDYQLYKARKVTCLELADFFYIAKTAFEDVENPELSTDKTCNTMKGNSKSSLNRHVNVTKNSRILTSGQEIGSSVNDGQSSSGASKDKRPNVEGVEISNSLLSNDSVANNSSPINKVLLSSENIDKKCESKQQKTSKKHSHPIINTRIVSSCSGKNEAEDKGEDDEIFVYIPEKKLPPLIVLDDDEQLEVNSVSTSKDLYNNEENPSCRTNLDNDLYNYGQTIPIAHISQNVIINNEKKNSNRNVVLPSRISEDSRKRKLSSSSSSSYSSSDDDDDKNDDYIKIINRIKKPPLTGTVQTFHKPTTPAAENVRRHLEEGIVYSPVSIQVSDQKDISSEQQSYINGHKCSDLCQERCPWNKSEYNYFLEILMKHNRELAAPEIRRKKKLFQEISNQMAEKCQAVCKILYCKHELHRLKIFYTSNKNKNLKGAEKRLFRKAQKIFETIENPGHLKKKVSH